METATIQIEDIRVLLSQRRFQELRTAFRDLATADIAELFDPLEITDCIVLFRLIPKPRRAEVFSYMAFERQEEMIDRLPDEVVANVLNEMEPSDRTQLFEELPDGIVNRLLLKLSPKERMIAKQLLSYPEESVGRLMSPDFIALKAAMSVKDAIEFIRWDAQERAESALHRLYVVDDGGKLLGHLSLASLVTADPGTLPVEKIMDTTQQPLMAYADESAAVDFFRKYDSPYIPVVDDQNVLVGVIEADTVFDVAEEEATEDIQQFGGQATLEDSYFQTSLPVLIRKRAGWLALLFLGSMLTTNAMQHFDATIQSMSFLVFFLPLIISSGGNSGSQAASLMIRGLAVREVDLKDWHKVLMRELVVGLLLGLVLGCLGYARAVMGHQGHYIGVVIALSLISVVTFGAVVGSMLPFLLKLSKLDPAVSSSPMIASIMDLTGIVLFFNVAVFIFKTLAGQ